MPVTAACVRLIVTLPRFLSKAVLGHTYHCSAVISAGQQWRLRHGKSRSGTEYGPLTDLPDWSYADGRPAPPSKGQMRRTQTQRVINERICQLISEMDMAKSVHEEAVSTDNALTT